MLFTARDRELVEWIGRFGAVEQLREAKGAGGSIGKHGATEHGDARIDERRRLAFSAPDEPAVRAHREIAAAVIADAACLRRQQQQRVHAGRLEYAGKPLQVRSRALDPDRVSVEVEKRRGTERRQRPGHNHPRSVRHRQAVLIIRPQPNPDGIFTGSQAGAGALHGEGERV